MLSTLPSCFPFVIEAPAPIYSIKFLSGDEFVEELKSKWNDRGVVLELYGSAGHQLTQPVDLWFGFDIDFRNQAESLGVFPERIQCSFSGIPMVIDEIYSNEKKRTKNCGGVSFKCNLPTELLTNLSLIRNDVIITLDGFIEYNGKALAFDTVYAQITHFDKWLNKPIHYIR
jgi:hypothetical protein